MKSAAGRDGLVDASLTAGHGDPVASLSWAVRAMRWKLISRGEIDPSPTESLPAEVWRRRNELDERLAA